MKDGQQLPDGARPVTAREIIELEIERLISLLDAFDGDADLEADVGEDRDENPLTLNPAWQPVRQVRRRRIGEAAW